MMRDVPGQLHEGSLNRPKDKSTSRRGAEEREKLSFLSVSSAPLRRDFVGDAQFRLYLLTWRS